MLIRSGNAKRDALAIADDIISQSDSLFGLLKWVTDFQRIRNWQNKALQLSTQIEIAKRMMQSKRSVRSFR